MRRLRPIAVLCGLLAGACSGDDGAGATGDTDYMDDQPPSGCDTDVCTTGMTTTGVSSTTGGPPQDECQSSADCGPDQACVAEFTGTGRGVYRCVDVCLQNLDESMWCADAAACCSAMAVCTDRGYCVDDVGGGSETGTSTSTSTSTGTGTGTGTGG